MSRVKETLDTINETKKATHEMIEKPTLFLIPMLSQIALSLAVIADKYTEGGGGERDESNRR